YNSLVEIENKEVITEEDKANYVALQNEYNEHVEAAKIAKDDLVTKYDSLENVLNSLSNQINESGQSDNYQDELNDLINTKQQAESVSNKQVNEYEIDGVEVTEIEKEPEEDIEENNEQE